MNPSSLSLVSPAQLRVEHEGWEAKQTLQLESKLLPPRCGKPEPPGRVLAPEIGVPLLTAPAFAAEIQKVPYSSPRKGGESGTRAAGSGLGEMSS